MTAPLLQQASPRTILPAVPRIIAIGDLHGDLEKARRAFRLGGLIDENDRWIGGTTTAVQVLHACGMTAGIAWDHAACTVQHARGCLPVRMPLCTGGLCTENTSSHPFVTPSTQSRCVQVGDQLDRGHQEIEILYFLERLEREAAAAGGALHVLNGDLR